MKFKEIKDLVKVLDESKFDDYELVFWDYARQKKMDGHFGSLSHPEKEITIPIGVVDEKFFPRVNVSGLEEMIPSPFQEGSTAYLKKEDDYEMNGVKFTRYFYECEATGKQFGTAASETFTMCEYYHAECKRLREEKRELQESLDIANSRVKNIYDLWDKIGSGSVETENDT